MTSAPTPSSSGQLMAEAPVWASVSGWGLVGTAPVVAAAVCAGVAVGGTGSGVALAAGVAGELGGTCVGGACVLVAVGGAVVGAGGSAVATGGLAVCVGGGVTGAIGGVTVGLLGGAVCVGVTLGVGVGVGVGVGAAVAVGVGVGVGAADAVWVGFGLGIRGGAAVRVGVGTAVGVGVGTAVGPAGSVGFAVGVGVVAGTRGTRSCPTAENSPGIVPPLLPSSCASGVCKSRIFAAHDSDGEVTFAVPLTVTGPRSNALDATTIDAGSPTASVAVLLPVDANVAPFSTTVPVAPARFVARETVPFFSSAPSVVNCRLPEWFAGARAPTFAAPSRMLASVLLTSALRGSGTRPRKYSSPLVPWLA